MLTGQAMSEVEDTSIGLYKKIQRVSQHVGQLMATPSNRMGVAVKSELAVSLVELHDLIGRVLTGDWTGE